MSAAAASILNHPDQFFIGGKWVAAASDAQFSIITPSTEELYMRFAEANEEDVNRAVAAARHAFDHGPWPRMSHAERAVYLRAIGQALLKRGPQVADMWTSEMGILNSSSRTMMETMHTVYDYYADLAGDFPFEEKHTPTAGGDVGLIVREPVGVVAAIIPWNGPIGLITNKLAPALIAGCTVIIKSSPETPGAGYVMAEIAEEVGLPAGVVNIITADRAVSELLVRHPGVDKVTMTGSSAAGSRIASICGERMARCTLELGGKSPAVILDDYDIGQAAETIAGMALLLNGQVCSSLTRIIVPRKRHDEMVDALSSHFAKVRVGDPFDEKSEMGPLAMQRQRDRVEHYIGKGKEEGAKLAVGGKRPSNLNQGYYIEPTVFGDVDNNMTIAREEIFGPVLSVIPADSENQAVDIANDTIFGLNASVFTNDSERAYQVARKIRAGTVGQNSFRTDFGIAFGGFKKSGIGREGGREGLYPFLETKTVIL